MAYIVAGRRKFAGLGGTVTAPAPSGAASCSATERRIKPIVEPSSDQIVDVAPEHRTSSKPVQLLRATYEAYRRLKTQAEADGLPSGLMRIISGYRSVARQKQLWADALEKYGTPEKARRWVAPPGGSAHHTGRAIDFWLGEKNASSNVEALRKTLAYRWLVCNAERFGFTPYAHEPWHWEHHPQDAVGGNGRGAPSTPIVEAAIREGVRDESEITNRVFFARHPERGGRRIGSGEAGAAQEWLSIRDGLVRAALRAARAVPAGQVTVPPQPAAPPAAPAPPQPAAPPAAAPASDDALAGLAGYAAPGTASTVANCLAITRLIAAYHAIPWRVCFTILEHEGGHGKFGHNDGVMQTTSGARQRVIPRIPAALKRVLLGLSFHDATPDATLATQLHGEFRRRLAVQIACGIQELRENLAALSDYVALAYQAYNVGIGWSYYTVTNGASKGRPSGIAPDQWERMCRAGAALLHRRADGIRVSDGVWQCDKNIPTWFRHYAVYEGQTGRQLIGYKYLRSFQGRYHQNKPALPCDAARHKSRDPGSGPVVTERTRGGALDKLYDPRLLRQSYYSAAQAELQPIADDGAPLRVLNGRLVKVSA